MFDRSAPGKSCLLLTLGTLMLLASGCLPVVAGVVLGIFEATKSATSKPVVVVGSIERTAQPNAVIPVTVFDNESERVTLNVEFRTAETGWNEASTSPAQVEATPQGVSRKLAWEAASDLPSGTTYRDDIELRITPRDSEHTGDSVVVSAIEYGNDAPIITTFELEEQSDGFVFGTVKLTVGLQDSAADFVELEAFELVLPDGQGGESVESIPIDSENFPIGTILEMGTQVPPEEFVHTFGWNSEAEISANVANAFVRLRVRELDTDPPLASEWVESEPFTLRTQTPPVAHILEVTRPDGGGMLAGATGIYYALFDEQSDPTDVAFEYSLDDGLTWHRCTEYRTPHSEGRIDLETAPAALGGVRHTFFWDTRADTVTRRNNVLLRLTAADDYAVGPSAEVQMPMTVGADDASPIYAVQPAQLGSEQTRSHALATLDGGQWPYLVMLYHEARTGEEDIHTLHSYPAGAGIPNTTEWTGDFAALPTGQIEHTSDEAVYALLLADITGNGYDDAVYVWEDGEVEVFAADGNGGFGASPTSTTTGLSVLEGHALVTDLSDNGRPDLFLAAKENNDTDIEVWLNDAGSGTFSPAFDVLLTGGELLTMTTGDATQNERPDLIAVVAQAGETRVHVYENLGSGSFSSTPLKTTVAAADSDLGAICAADFTGNGTLDLALGSSSTSFGLRVYAGLGNGQFETSPRYQVATQVRQLVAMDISRDGRLDLVGDFGNALRVYANTGAEGSLLALPPLSLDTAAQGLADADMHGDGDPSLVVRLSEGYQVATAVGRRGSGLGRFAPPTILGEWPVWDLELGDFNRNGHLDIALVTGTETLHILWGSARGTFTPEHLELGSPLFGLLKGDFTGDGHLELLTLHFTEPALRRIEFDERGEPDPQPLEDAGVAGPQHPAFAADFTGDGSLDLLVTSFPFGAPAADTYLLTNDGSGSFSAHPTTYEARTPIAVADFTGNGAYDWLAAPHGLGPRDLFIMGGDGSGAFSGDPASVVVPNVVPSPEAVVVADVNHNGILDMVYADALDGLLHTIKGIGVVDGVASGDYQFPDSEPFPPSASLVGADFTGSGTLDLVAGGSSNEWSFARGLDEARLASGTNWPVGRTEAHASLAGGISMLRAADMNNDGLLDLVGVTNTDRLFVAYGRPGPRQSAFEHRALPDVRTFGPGVNEPRTLRHGAMTEEVVPGINLRRYAGAFSAGRGPAEESVTLEAPQFQGQVQRAAKHTPSLSLPAGLVPVTHAWHAEGERRLSTGVEWFEDNQLTVFIERLRVENRLGERLSPGSEDFFEREGLDLADEPARGIILELPLRPGKELQHDAQDYVIYLRALDWDRDGGNPETAELPLLPVYEDSPFPVDFRSEVRERWRWLEIEPAPNNDFEAPSDEPRFRILPNHPEGPRIEVLTDRLGVLQAFRKVTPR